MVALELSSIYHGAEPVQVTGLIAKLLLKSRRYVHSEFIYFLYFDLMLYFGWLFQKSTCVMPRIANKGKDSEVLRTETMNQIEQDSIEWNLVQRHLKNFVFHFCKIFSHFEKYQERKLHYRHCKNKVICYPLCRTIVKPWAQLESGIDELSGRSAWTVQVITGPDLVRVGPDVGEQWKSGQLCLVLVQPDIQIRDSFFLNLVRIRTTGRHWTRFSGKYGQNETRTVLSTDVCLQRTAFFLKSGQNPDNGQNRGRLSGFKKKAFRCLSLRPEKGETELFGLSLVRRRLVRVGSEFLESFWSLSAPVLDFSFFWSWSRSMICGSLAWI